MKKLTCRTLLAMAGIQKDDNHVILTYSNLQETSMNLKQMYSLSLTTARNTLSVQQPILVLFIYDGLFKLINTRASLIDMQTNLIQLSSYFPSATRNYPSSRYRLAYCTIEWNLNFIAVATLILFSKLVKTQTTC